MENKRPRILLNTVVNVIREREWDTIISEYVQRVVDAGGLPILMPSVESTDLTQEYLAQADGVVLIGGPDYHPRFYGEEPVPETCISRIRPACDIIFCQQLLHLLLVTFSQGTNMNSAVTITTIAFGVLVMMEHLCT